MLTEGVLDSGLLLSTIIPALIPPFCHKKTGHAHMHVIWNMLPHLLEKLLYNITYSTPTHLEFAETYSPNCEDWVLPQLSFVPLPCVCLTADATVEAWSATSGQEIRHTCFHFADQLSRFNLDFHRPSVPDNSLLLPADCFAFPLAFHVAPSVFFLRYPPASSSLLSAAAPRSLSLLFFIFLLWPTRACAACSVFCSLFSSRTLGD